MADAAGGVWLERSIMVKGRGGSERALNGACQASRLGNRRDDAISKPVEKPQKADCLRKHHRPPEGCDFARLPDDLYEVSQHSKAVKVRNRYHTGMFSYRHAFHAGNHADVLKHTVLIATLQYLTEKDAALTVLDTHAGAGLYRLDGDYASTSAEASDGILRLVAPKYRPHPALAAYVDMVRAFNQGSKTRVYPGSPFISQRLLRGHDKLKLFELHPTDMRALAGNVASWKPAGKWPCCTRMALKASKISASTSPPRFAAVRSQL